MSFPYVVSIADDGLHHRFILFPAGVFRDALERSAADFETGLLCDQVAVISHAAWVAGAIMVVSNSMGVNRPRWSCCLR